MIISCLWDEFTHLEVDLAKEYKILFESCLNLPRPCVVETRWTAQGSKPQHWKQHKYIDEVITLIRRRGDLRGWHFYNGYKGHFTHELKASPPYRRKACFWKPLWRAPSLQPKFLTHHSPTVSCFLALHIEKVSGIFHVSITHKCMRPKRIRNVGATWSNAHLQG